MAASFERSPGALADVPGACLPQVLRLLGTDVPLELAVPVTFPFCHMPRCSMAVGAQCCTRGMSTRRC